MYFNQKDTDIFSNCSNALRSIKGYEFKYIFSVFLHMLPEKNPESLLFSKPLSSFFPNFPWVNAIGFGGDVESPYCLDP